MPDVRSRDDPRIPLPPGTRRRVLELLSTAETPLSAAEIASRIQLHVTTIRFHVDQLESAGLVRRSVKRIRQRGRPQVQYSAAPSTREDNANHQLVDVLARSVSTDADGGQARSLEAGKNWAEMLAPDVVPTSDGDLGPLIRVMERLGFEPELDDTEPAAVIRLLACPFRQAASDHPAIVCSIHRGIIQKMLGKIGRAPGDGTLHPFVQPNLCTVTLEEPLGHQIAS